jgi:crossover junction endodeoxyribonuclease RusA
MTVTFTVRGIPVPQGSARAFIAGGRAIVATEAHRGSLGAWRTAIATEARAAMGEDPLLTGPVRVDLLFVLPRPKSAPKRRLYPDGKPDVDKLARAALDALTGVVFSDDARVCLLKAAKVYPGEAAGYPGVHVDVEGMR